MSVVLAECRLSFGQVAAEWRPSGGEVSARCRPTCVSVDVGQYVDRVSADISAECRSIYRPRLGRHIGREYRPILSRQMS